jgi:type IV pilus assembly protein PilO
MELQNLPWYGQLLVFLVIGGIVFLIFYFAYYSDNQARIVTISNQIVELEKEIRTLEKKKTQVKELEAEVAANKATLEKLKEILPEQKEVSQILKKVQSIITSARLDIQKWSTMSEQSREIYVEVPFGITVDGNYHNLGMFFDQLAKLKKIFTVNNLTLKPLSKMTRDFTVKATFTAVTYTFKEKGIAPAKKAAPPKRRTPPPSEEGGGKEMEGV